MYRLCLFGLWITTAATQNSYNIDSRTGKFQGKSNNFGPLYSAGFGGSNNYGDDSYEDNAVTPTPPAAPLYRQAQQPIYRKPSASSDGTVRIGPGLRGGSLRVGPQYEKNAPVEEPVEEEKDEPDRLSLLLPQSKFDCVGKQTGYYADEELNCEVFHYCHDNAKHSWICPEGFTFHQVHLICMPPNGDINCKKSSNYHFVNEYLYKPVNLEEAESKPNVTLRYSERYFPGDIFTDERESGEYQSPSNFQKRPLNQQALYLSHQAASSNTLSTASRPTSHGYQQSRTPVNNQVFRSPEEVNIPLQQRRPQQHQQILRKYPHVRSEEDDYE